MVLLAGTSRAAGMVQGKSIAGLVFAVILHLSRYQFSEPDRQICMMQLRSHFKIGNTI